MKNLVEELNSVEDLQSGITVTLVKNQLSKDSSFFARVKNRLATVKATLGLIAKKKGVDSSSIKSSLSLYNDEVLELLSMGYAVKVLDLGVLQIKLRGSIKSKEEVSNLNNFSVEFTPSNAVSEAVKNLKIEAALEVDSEPVPDTITQAGERHATKVFGVNVINEGDPLEIYTSKEGEVIFKKYSLMGGVDEFAAQICETLNKTTGLTVAVTDRDSVVAAAGSARRDLIGKRISTELEQIMEDRAIYRAQGSERSVYVTDTLDRCCAAIAAPIISEGDALGLVLFVENEGENHVGETEYKLAQTIASFLGRHMES